MVESAAGALLREARRRAGLSQAQLGQRAGLPQSVVSAYERGQRLPSFDAVVHLLEAAGFDPEVTLLDRASEHRPFTGPVGRRLQRRRARARALLQERGYLNPGVFGSVARGTDRPGSDLDLLVDLPNNGGLIELNRAAIDLEDLLGVRVDLIPRSGLRPRIAATVAAEVVPL